MASLGKISELLKINSPPSTKIHPVEPLMENPKKFIARKRRAWLEEEPEKKEIELPPVEETREGYKPLIEKGSINPLNNPLISTPFMDEPDQPHIKKGAIEGCYKPLLLSFDDLRGNPLKMILYFYEITKNEEERKSKRITMSDLIMNLRITRDSARTAVRFLMKHGCLYRVGLKIGKHGWSQYTINENIFGAIKRGIEKSVINPFKEPEFSESYKGFISSNNILNNTTTIDKKFSGIGLPVEWGEINIEPLRQIKFSKTHILQIFREGKLTPEMVQESLYAFAFDLYENKKIEKYGDPLRVIMGIFRDGIPYNAPSNYESPKEKARRVYLEQQREKEKKRAEEEQEMVKYAFKEWEAHIPEEEKNKIVSPLKPSSSGFWPVLLDFFTKNVWPEKKKEIYGNL